MSLLRSLAALALSLVVVAASAADPKKSRADKVAAKAAETPATAPKTTPVFTLPSLQRELPNGLKVVVVRTPQKGLVSLQIAMQTGSRNEVEAGKTGFAHFFEHMMFRGTERHSADQYQALMKAAGADQNAYTASDYTNYYANFTPADLDTVLELEADRFQNLKYSEEQFRTEALAVKGEYLKNFSNPLAKAQERLLDLAYTTHTYKHTGMGFFADIEKMPDQMEYARTFFDRWYRPEYATLLVVGDVEPEPTFDLVKKHWSGWQRGSYKVEIPAEPEQTSAKYEHVAWESPTLPHLLVGWHAPAFRAESTDLPALTLLAEIHFGETSPLYQKLVVREQLLDQLDYQVPRERDPGMFLLVARLTKPEHAAKVTSAIQDAIVAARAQPVDAAQLARVQSRLKYGFTRSLASAATTGGMLARFVHYERDLETVNRYYASFDRVRPADLVAVAGRVFRDGNRTTISVASQASLEGADAFAASGDAPPATTAATPTVAGTEEPARKSPEQIFAERDEAKRLQSDLEWGAASAKTVLKEVVQRSDSPLVDVSLLFDVGAAYDPAGKRGLAALTAALVAQGGSRSRTIEQIQNAYYPYAADLSMQVDKEVTRFSAQVHRDNLGSWWTVAAEQLTEPGFRAEDFTRLKQQQLNAIRTGLRGNNDEEFAKEALYESVYGPEHPYGTLTLGKAGELETITLEDVEGFYRRWYVLDRLRLGLAGNFHEQAQTRILSDLWRMGRTKVRADKNFRPKADVAALDKQRSALVIAKESPSVAVSIGVPIALKRGDPDWVALWLARAWLGEHRNSAGHLYQRIRGVRGMNYGDYAYIEYFPNGMYLMQPEPNYPRRNDLFQVWLRPLRSNNDAVFATRVALNEIDRLVRTGMTAEEFESTRAYLDKFVAVLTAHQSKQLGYALDSEWHKMPEFVAYVRDGLKALTLDQVNAAIRKHMDMGGARFVYITKDAKGLAAMLQSSAATPITYNTEKPAELKAEDARIAKLPLKLAKDRITVRQDKDLFE